MKIGMIFPGQGSQFVGMAKGFYDEERLVQELFEEASHCLDQNFVKLCFASSEKDLMETINTQTSIFLVSASIFRLLQDKYGVAPTVVAGHSLGEYGALYAAGGINFPDALYLLKKRAHFMEEATKSQSGGMLAVLSFPEDQLRAIVDRYNKLEETDAVAEIVNINSPRQFVVSGTLDFLQKIKEDVEAARGKTLFLKVSGAFHSRLMNEAQKNFSSYLEKVDIHDVKVPLINNVEARVVASSDEIKQSLVRGVSSPVLWWQSIQHFRDCDVIIEIGPGSKFTKLISREWPHLKIISINEQRDINDLIAYLDELKKSEDKNTDSSHEA